MFPSDNTTVFDQVGRLLSRPTRRVPKNCLAFGLESEALESRALLSAATLQIAGCAPANVIQAGPKIAVAPLTVNGMWNMNITSGSHQGSATTTITQTGAKGTFALSYANFDAVTFTGKLNKNNQFLGSAKILVNGKNVGVKLTVSFSGGANPTSFSGFIKQGSKVLEAFTGSKL